MADPLKKMLFIGCGGSGAETIRMIRRDLVFRLATLGIPEDRFPSGWQFISVDVPAQRESDAKNDGVDRGIPYAALSNAGMTYQGPNGVDQLLVSKEQNRRGMDFAQWRPNPDRFQFDMTRGAGQVRAYGRAIGVWSLEEAFVQNKLPNALAAMRDTQDDAGLLAVEQALGMDLGAGRESIAVVVSSLGGGAGSGIFLDVLDALRFAALGQDTWLQNAFGIYFDPTTFEHEATTKNNSDGIRPNSLVAMSEARAAFLAKDWSRPRYFAPNNQDGGSRRGAEYSLYFGSTSINSNFVTKDRQDTYEFVASLLSSLTINPTSGAEFFRKTIGNVGIYSAAVAPRPIDGQVAGPNIMSAGFASVGTGRERFAHYAGERMTRYTIDQIRNFGDDLDAAGRVARGQATRDDEVARIIADGVAGEGNLISQFLRECQLNEDGEADNAVMDRIVQGMKEFPKKMRDQLKGYVRDQVGDDLISLDRILGAISRSGVVELTAANAYDIPSMRGVISEAVGEWAADLQVGILDTVCSWVFRYGIHVTSAVVAGVTKMLQESIPAQLKQEIENLRTSYATANPLAEIPGLLKQNQGRSSTSLWTIIDTKIEAMVDMLQGREVREAAGQMLIELAINLFGPLNEALKEGAADIGAISQTSIDSLSAESVARHLRPPENEMMLTPVEEFDDRYRDFVQGALPLRQAFCGKAGADSQKGAVQLLNNENQNSPWKIGNSWAPNLGEGAERLQVTFDFTLRGIQDRCLGWLHAPENASKAFIDESIRSVVIGYGPAETVVRARNLFLLLETAFHVAEPKVLANTAYLRRVFNVETSMNWSFVGIPFSMDELGDAGTAILRMLQNNGVEQPEGRFLGAGASEPAIVVYGCLLPIPPVGLQAMASQILASYERLGSETFWTGRQSRPLMEAIPLPREVQLQLIRGWITAQLLNLVAIGATKSCEIEDPDSGQSHQMITSATAVPEGTTVDSWEYLAGALQASLLADMASSMGDTSGMDALNVLLALGSSSGELVATNDYRTLNRKLTDWAPPGLVNFGGATDVPAALRWVIERYRDADARIETTPTWQRCQLDVQIAPLITQAAEQMLAAAVASPG